MTRSMFGTRGLAALAAATIAAAALAVSAEPAKAGVRFTNGTTAQATFDCFGSFVQLKVGSLQPLWFWVDVYDAVTRQRVGYRTWTYMPPGTATPTFWQSSWGARGTVGYMYYVTFARWTGYAWDYQAEYAREDTGTYAVTSTNVTCWGYVP